jgi:leucyl aminopeptidase
MEVVYKRGAPARLRTPLLCVPLFEGESLRAGAMGELDAACGGALGALARSGDFSGRLWTQALLYNPNAGGPRRVLALGVGDRAHLDLERVRQAAARAVKRASDLGVDEFAILFPTRPPFAAQDVAQALTEGTMLGAYRYDRYLTARDGQVRKPKTATFLVQEDPPQEALQTGIGRGLVLGDVVCSARDMVNAPGNELTPTEMAQRAATAAKRHGYRCTVLERREIQKLGMGGLTAVAQGSDQPPRFIVLEYDGAPAKTPPFVIVGKGLTFDAGGLCLKPPTKMDEMKGDMAGGAAALGVIEAAARLGVPARIVALVPATENLLGASAYRPGDILKMMSGKTVFVDNTDAEGRLILGDALAYAQRYRPRAIVDLATLTGAVLVALGQVATAVLGNDRKLVRGLVESGDRTFERLWELPLWDEFEELIKSPIADIKNSGGKNGGTITAAAFLRHFVGSTPWAHLDIAGTSYLDKAEGYRPAGGTGVGIRLLVDYIEHQAQAPAHAHRAPARRTAAERPSRNGRNGSAAVGRRRTPARRARTGTRR